MLLLAGASYARAATAVWTGPSSGGLFNDAANWSSPAAPGANADDLAIFNSTTNVDGTVTFSDSVLLRDAHFRNTSGTIELDVGEDNAYTMTRNTIVGAAAGEVNHVIASSGQLESGIVFLGNASGADGNRLTVTGGDTFWRATGGTAGTAAIRVGSNGGSNSSLTIADGAAMASQTQAIVGLQSASNNTVTVTGTGSELSVVHSFSLGDNIAAGLPAQTNNQLKVLDGGFVTVRELIIGTTENSPGNTVTVSGAGSRLNVRGGQQSPPTEVGQNNDVGRASTNNSLLVEDGGVVDGGAIFMLGRFESSTGNLLSINGGGLSGTGIKVLRGKLLIENGSVEINRVLDGLVNVILGGMLLAELPTSEIEFRSGSLATPSATITNGSAFVVGDGGSTPAVYRMKPDIGGTEPRGSGADIITHTFAGGLHLNSNGVLEGNGDIVGNVSGVTGAKAKIGGPSSLGVIDVSGTWNNRRIEVQLEIGDLSASTVAGVGHDLLNVQGNFVHGTGSRILIDVSQFVAGLVEEIKIIGWTGQVSADVGSAVSFIGGPALSYQFKTDGLYVTANMASNPGDYNGDGTVDAADYVVWRKTDGTPVGYEKWRTHFGETAGDSSSTGSGSASVPEPATWFLGLSLAAVGLSAPRRLHRRA
ncbi:MAG: hypothetical protein WD738_22455 [Pirellulales bacterium]